MANPTPKSPSPATPHKPQTNSLLVRIGLNIGVDGSGKEELRDLKFEHGGARWLKRIMGEEKPCCNNITEQAIVDRLIRSKVYSNPDEARADLQKYGDGAMIKISEGPGHENMELYTLRRAEKKGDVPRYEFKRAN